jgi:paraquat-inducible protein A
VDLVPNPAQLACHECDKIVTIPELEDGHKAICPRCGFVFTRYFKKARSRLLAFSSSSLVFLLLSFVFPFLIFNSQGNEKVITLVQSLQSLGNGTYFSVVLFMLATTVLVPVIILTGINYTLISAKLDKPLPYTRHILKLVFQLQPWNMAEIFLLGILVSMIKIASLGHVQLGWSFYSFILYIFSMAATRVFLDKYQVWQWFRHHDKRIYNHEC